MFMVGILIIIGWSLFIVLFREKLLCKFIALIFKFRICKKVVFLLRSLSITLTPTFVFLNNFSINTCLFYSHTILYLYFNALHYDTKNYILYIICIT